ncbi:MAG: SpoIIE family protein phosphatase [Bdellovibrionales bacterium]|nr:SpoIIE family protein phosphatase [Bdellovibrionales bacterium]
MLKLPALKIRHKILLFIIALLIFALITYSLLATRLFNADKTAYIYETNALLVETLAADLQTSMASTLKTMEQISNATSHKALSQEGRSDFIRTLFQSDPNLTEITIYQMNQPGRSLASSDPILHMYKLDYLKLYELDKDFFMRLRANRNIPLARLEKQNVVLEDATIQGGAPMIAVYLKTHSNSNESHVVVGNLRKDKIIGIFSRSDVYTSFLIDEFGEPLAQTSHGGDTLHLSQSKNFIKDILGSEFSKGAKEFVDEQGMSYIGAYNKFDLGKLSVFSYISKDKAFLAAKQLVEKTVLVGIMILLCSVIFSVLFSRRLTAALNRLYNATLKISRGEFDLKVDIKSRDEVGALSKAFDKMTEEIQRLLTETHEKAQIEKEIETAKTVQDNLFPHKTFLDEKFQLSGYYTPASTCGGDWWGYIPVGNKVVILIGDATGHGVPSALVTAAAQSCCTTLRQLGIQFNTFLLTPAQIMTSLNTAIYHAAKGSIKMTFFVSVVDLDTGMMHYSNASHEMPMVSKIGPDGKRTRKTMTVLTGRPDEALGDTPKTKYHQHEYQLAAGDVILWYTDGITEYRNQKTQQEWGESRLLRALIKCADGNVDDIKSHVISNAIEFGEQSAADDDMTLVVGKVSENVRFRPSV